MLRLGVDERHLGGSTTLAAISAAVTRARTSKAAAHCVQLSTVDEGDIPNDTGVQHGLLGGAELPSVGQGKDVAGAHQDEQSEPQSARHQHRPAHEGVVRCHQRARIAEQRAANIPTTFGHTTALPRAALLEGHAWHDKRNEIPREDILPIHVLQYWWIQYR